MVVLMIVPVKTQIDLQSHVLVSRMAYTEPLAVTVLCTVPLAIEPAMPPFVGWEVMRKAFFALPKTAPPAAPPPTATPEAPPATPFEVTDIAPAEGSMPLAVL